MAPRTMLYTGKGGVGKTSVAAATARRTAAQGLRTLLVSTDPAHSLADVLEAPAGPEPTPAGPSLWVQEIDAEREDEDGAAAPGGLELDEVRRLLVLGRHFEDDDYDVIVVDCAATGETLRLLAFPDLARRSPRAAAQAAGEGENDGSGLVRDLVALNEILTDHDHVSVRLVLTPDRVVVAEARRTYTHLGLYGLLTDAVIVNRVFPDDVGPYFDGWRARQAEQLADVRRTFGPAPVLCAPFYPDEVTGAAALDRLGDALFAGHDAAAVLSRTPEQEPELVLTREGATLRLSLPFATPEDVTLKQVGLDLVVRAAGHRRTLALPPALADYRPRGATVRDGALVVDFDRISHG